MRRFIFGLAFANLALATSAIAVADDAAITQQIAAKLREQQRLSNLKGFDIGVQVDDGTVTVGGRVSTAEHGRLALDIARRVPGVRMVVNDLHVGAVKSKSSARTPRRPLTSALAGLTGAAKLPTARRENTGSAVNQLASLVTSGDGVIGSGTMGLPPTPTPVAGSLPAAAAATPGRQAPLAFARSTFGATLAAANGAIPGGAVPEALPVPAHLPTTAPSGIARAAYDHPKYAGLRLAQLRVASELCGSHLSAAILGGRLAVHRAVLPLSPGATGMAKSHAGMGRRLVVPGLQGQVILNG